MLFSNILNILFYTKCLRLIFETSGRSGDRIPVGCNFSNPSRPAVEPTQPPVQWVPGLFAGGKAAGAWHNHPPPSSVEVKEIVQLHL